MQFNGPSAELGHTVILAYPDDTRLAGYRAGLELWRRLDGSSSGAAAGSVHQCSIGAKSVQVVQPQNVPQIAVPFDREDEDAGSKVPVVFATPSAHSELSFCFVSGLPAPEHVPELVDCIITYLEKHGVQRLLIPAAANISGTKGDDQLWVELHMSSAEQSKHLLADIPRIPVSAQTSDVVLSAVSNIGAMSAIDQVALLVHADKRPSGSGYRQTVGFGAEYVDESDTGIVDALVQALSLGVGAVDAAAVPGQLPVEAVRVRLDADCAGAEAIFG
ncbi:hypothetical protein GGF46_001565 [Coemansia sp. RSA 552]|nr:hypothetical protein GGF46_001565 [Coemansia sp. RSA 552]